MTPRPPFPSAVLWIGPHSQGPRLCSLLPCYIVAKAPPHTGRPLRLPASRCPRAGRIVGPQQKARRRNKLGFCGGTGHNTGREPGLLLPTVRVVFLNIFLFRLSEIKLVSGTAIHLNWPIKASSIGKKVVRCGNYTKPWEDLEIL